jgi:hypothetical protein
MFMNINHMLRDLEKEVLEKAAREMAEQIDFEVLSQLLGWTKVELPEYPGRFISMDIDIWIEQNCSGTVRSLGSKFIFENPKDATLFILRWV